MVGPKLTVTSTLVPEVAVETVPEGLLFVTAVLVPEIKFEVVQVTFVSLQVEALLAMVQLVAERVPEGGGAPQAAVLQDWVEEPTQLAPPHEGAGLVQVRVWVPVLPPAVTLQAPQDRKSTRLNSSHSQISYA